MGGDLVSPLGWRAIGASVAGTSHAGSGEPCADACAVGVIGATGGDSLLVAVAADGAGTAERAPEGARLACEAILEQAELWTLRTTERAEPYGPAFAEGISVERDIPRRDLSTFTREDVLLWVDAARRRIADAAESRGLESREFSCTLLVALVDERAAVFFQVGDGAIVYRTAGGDYAPAFWPQSGEYANSTCFVTDEDLAERVESAVTEGIQEVALLTDGLQALALRFGSREAHGPFFEPMFARLRGETAGAPAGLLAELRSFLDSPPVNERTNDDKTLILATRLAATSSGEANTEA